MFAEHAGGVRAIDSKEPPEEPMLYKLFRKQNCYTDHMVTKNVDVSRIRFKRVRQLVEVSTRINRRVCYFDAHPNHLPFRTYQLLLLIFVIHFSQ